MAFFFVNVFWFVLGTQHNKWSEWDYYMCKRICGSNRVCLMDGLLESCLLNISNHHSLKEKRITLMGQGQPGQPFLTCIFNNDPFWTIIDPPICYLQPNKYKSSYISIRKLENSPSKLIYCQVYILNLLLHLWYWFMHMWNWLESTTS